MTVLELTDYGQKIVDGEWMDALFGPVVGLVGLQTVAVVAIGSVTLALWAWSSSFVLMATWLALAGGAILSAAPAKLVYLAYVSWALAIAIGLLGVIVGDE